MCGYVGVIKSPRIPALCPEQDWSNLRQSIFFFIQIWRICYALQIVFCNVSSRSDNLRERFEKAKTNFRIFDVERVGGALPAINYKKTKIKYF